ncbi:MAG TPA: hypothetical protein DCZ69_19580 [Syntrophobacteraceae bacterium]|jgi:FKBP-type peptidyl-prolyl cis-trans isomerase|nr:hypothetical protein [Syntrophobacteraceae bacterium]
MRELKQSSRKRQTRGVVTLPSGLQYKVLKDGKEDSPKNTYWATVHQRRTLLDGTEVDSSYAWGKPSNIQVSGVIKGWTEALQLMKPGGKCLFQSHLVAKNGNTVAFHPTALWFSKSNFLRSNLAPFSSS